MYTIIVVAIIVIIVVMLLLLAIYGRAHETHAPPGRTVVPMLDEPPIPAEVRRLVEHNVDRACNLEKPYSYAPLQLEMFVNDMDGVVKIDTSGVSQPGDKELHLLDGVGDLVIWPMVKMARRGQQSAWFGYYWYEPQPDGDVGGPLRYKVSYVRRCVMNQRVYIIGSGVFLHRIREREHPELNVTPNIVAPARQQDIEADLTETVVGARDAIDTLHAREPAWASASELREAIEGHLRVHETADRFYIVDGSGLVILNTANPEQEGERVDLHPCTLRAFSAADQKGAAWNPCVLDGNLMLGLDMLAGRCRWSKAGEACGDNALYIGASYQVEELEDAQEWCQRNADNCEAAGCYVHNGTCNAEA